MADVKFLSNLVVDGNIDLTAGGGYQIKNATFESLTADPTSNNFEGRMIYRSDTNQVRFYDGSSWTSIAGDITGVTAGDGLGGGGTSGAVTLSVNVDDDTIQITSDAVVAKTMAVEDGGTSLSTSGQIHSFVTGGYTMTGNLLLNDNVELRLGTSTDLKIYHDGTDSRIANNTGNLYIQNLSDDKNIYLRSDNGSGGTATYLTIDGQNELVNIAKPLTLANYGAGFVKTDANGVVSIDSATYITGNQTITLSGDVTGSGTTAITTTIAANAVEASMLNNNIISGKTALTTGLASTDELLVSDAGTVKRMDVSVLQTYMQNNLTFTTNTDVDVSVSNLETRLGQIDSNVTIGNAAGVSVSTSGDLTVGGDLVVEGTTTTINSTTIAIDDHHMKVATDNSTTNDFGFYGRYNSTASFAGLFFDVSTEEWKFYANNGTEPGNTTFTPDELATIKAAGFVGDLSGNASTASSAAKWTNARTITLGGDLTGSVSIDGSADVTLTATVAADSVELGTDTTGNYVATVGAQAASGISVGGSGSEGASVTIAGIDASESAVGVVQLATAAQALAGSATDRVVTPAGLAARSYTTTIGGSSPFTVTHNLGTRNVIVQMYDSSSYETVYAQVVRTDANNVTVSTNSDVADNDITVLVTKVD